jgi:hypothetical protein
LCGDVTCASIGTHYCERFAAGPTPLISATCRELPAPCEGNPSCDCVEPLVEGATSCSFDAAGNVAITLPDVP